MQQIAQLNNGEAELYFFALYFNVENGRLRPTAVVRFLNANTDSS